jgi:hypothetical protein
LSSSENSKYFLPVKCVEVLKGESKKAGHQEQAVWRPQEIRPFLCSMEIRLIISALPSISLSCSSSINGYLYHQRVYLPLKKTP